MKKKTKAKIVEWVLLVAIMIVTAFAGFAFGGAHVAKKFDNKYRAIKKALDDLDRDRCEYDKFYDVQ